jgi:hypothetical protein
MRFGESGRYLTLGKVHNLSLIRTSALGYQDMRPPLPAENGRHFCCDKGLLLGTLDVGVEGAIVPTEAPTFPSPNGPSRLLILRNYCISVLLLNRLSGTPISA